MRDKLRDYKQRLEGEIAEYLALPVSSRSMAALEGMYACWEAIDGMECRMCGAERLTDTDLAEWCARMKNEDGSTGPHWTETQTTDVAKAQNVDFAHLTAAEWHAAMCMMYSDYYGVAMQYKANVPDFYAWLARAFLFDKDGPGPAEKLAAYYRAIVE